MPLGVSHQEEGGEGNPTCLIGMYVLSIFLMGLSDIGEGTLCFLMLESCIPTHDVSPLMCQYVSVHQHLLLTPICFPIVSTRLQESPFSTHIDFQVSVFKGNDTFTDVYQGCGCSYSKHSKLTHSQMRHKTSSNRSIQHIIV